MNDPRIGGNNISAGKWADKHTDIQLQALLNQDEEGVLMVDDLNVTEYISNQLKPLQATIKALTDRIKLLESITDQSCGCNGIDHEIKG